MCLIEDEDACVHSVMCVLPKPAEMANWVPVMWYSADKEDCIETIQEKHATPINGVKGKC